MKNLRTTMWKRIVSLLTILMILLPSDLTGFCVSASAATATPFYNAISSRSYAKIYALDNTQRTIPYTSKYLSTRGTVTYGANSSSYINNRTDEIYLYSVGTTNGKTWAYVSYPSGSRRVYAYIYLSTIVNSYYSDSKMATASGKFYCYQRKTSSSTSSSYYVAKGDTVYRVSYSNDRYQIMYPSGSTWRIAWCSKSDYNKYCSQTTPTPTPSPSLTSGRTIADGLYMIQSGNSSNCVLDINNWNNNDGGNLEIYGKNNTANQQFQVTYVGNGYYKIMANHSGKYLDVSGGSSSSQTNCWQYTWNGSNAQLWKIVSAGNNYYYIISKLGTYLDNSNGSTTYGNNVWLYTGNSSAAQKWKFISTSAASSNISISGQTNPTSIKKGSGFTVKGTVSSNYPLTNVTVKVLNSSGTAVLNVSRTPNYVTYNLNNLDSDVHFGQLGVGTYKYQVTASNRLKSNVVLQSCSFTVTGTNTTPNVSISYAPYTGVSYTNKGLSSARVAALNKAMQMVTIQWTAPCDFPTWASSSGSYNTATATDGTSNTKFVKGKTYTGIPYSMIDHSYDNVQWASLLKSGISTDSMSKRYYSSHLKKGTAKGIDCSYFVYQAIGTAVNFKGITYQSTSQMLNSSYYKKINLSAMKPGDLFLKNGHVMMFVGKDGNKYAVFEADADDSKCSYNTYSSSYISSYGCYKFKGFSD